MLQAYLFLTQSYLELDKLQRQITWQFFVQKKFSFESSQLGSNSGLESTETNSKQELEIEQTWQHFQNLGQILTTNFDDKRDAREQIMSFYQNYSEPTLLFLGNLQDYSTALQESLLKFLEEPPANLFLILLAHNSSELLGTIRSRCQIIVVPTGLVFKLLDPTLCESVKEKLPSPGALCGEFLKGQSPSLPDLKKVEREELDLWLWQIEKCLEGLWRQEVSKTNSKLTGKISTLLTKTLQTRQLNNQNLQKKLALGHLFLATSA